MTESDDDLQKALDDFDRLADMPHTRAQIASNTDPHINDEGLTDADKEFMHTLWFVTLDILSLAHTLHTNPEAMTTYAPILIDPDCDDQHTATFAALAETLQRTVLHAANQITDQLLNGDADTIAATHKILAANGPDKPQ